MKCTDKKYRKSRKRRNRKRELCIRLSCSSALLLTGIIVIMLAILSRNPVTKHEVVTYNTAVHQASLYADELCVTKKDVEFEDFQTKDKFSGALLFDIENQEILYSERANEKLYPASITKIMTASGIGGNKATRLPDSMIQTIEKCGFWESIPLWAVTLIGSLLVWVLSFVMILTVYGRFFKLYIYAAIAPVPLSAFAGEETSHIGKAFIRSFTAVCLEGAVIVLGCIIYSLFSSAPPSVSSSASAVTQVWTYMGELIFNMLVLVGTVKLSDRVVKDMMGL